MNKLDDSVVYLNFFGVEYLVEDVIEHISMPDSFVSRNKINNGHGEAKLYIGPRTHEMYYRKFFNNFDNIKCCFLKKDLEVYLENAKFEYEEQEQGYSRDIVTYWAENKSNIAQLKDIECFTISESSAGANRFYLKNPNTPVYDLFRQIMLPVITYISILKLRNLKDSSDIIFYFRPFLDYYYDKRSIVNRIEKSVEKIEEQTKISQNKKEDLISSRNGQGKYRNAILDEFPAGCLITKITDERILIASHIKPWVDSNNEEKMSKYNGLLLTPTYDRLFDQGFITFDNDGVLSISPYISNLTWRKLNLRNKQKFDLFPNPQRKLFLDYHKQHIFKDVKS